MGIFVVVDPDAPVFVHRYGNLADRQLGARALFVTNEFFAAVDRMLNPDPPVFIADKYDDNGKWMDGWETQRRRTCGYDYAIVKLFRPGVIFGVDMDTSNFVGNYPPAASMDACYCTDDAEVIRDGFEWTEIIASTALNPSKHHYVDVESRTVFTHVRVNIYPDGGLARLRIYGPPQCDWQMMRASNEPIDVAAMVNGAYMVAASNEAFGLASNMLRPGQASNMGGGWETRRRREPGHDWVIIALAHPAIIERIDVDTAFFKGNCPDRCSMHASFVPEDARGRGGGNVASLVTQSMFWQVLMPDQKLIKDSKHSFESDQLNSLGIVTHIRFNIIPDGGVSRLRVWGNIQ